MRGLIRSLALLACLVGGVSARAADGPPTAGERITVHGIRTEALNQTVEQIVSTEHGHQLARWQGAICPAVLGLQPAFANVITTHLTDAARRVGLQVQDSCTQNNVLILATDNASDVVEKVLARAPNLFQGFNANPDLPKNYDPPNPATVAALRVARPVRWFSATGIEAAGGNFTNRNSPVGRNMPVINVYGGGSFLSATTQEETKLVVLIVDVTLCNGVTAGALADYIAMSVLARPQMDASFSSLSIMSLFRDRHLQPDAPSGMTDLDRAILAALYKAAPAQDAGDEYAEIEEHVRGEMGR